MIAIGILFLVIGPLFLLLPHQMARLGRSGRERYEQRLRMRGVPMGRDEESVVSRVRERVAGGVLSIVGLVLSFLG
ncbi:MAG: hypothetical protein QGI84_05940 [Dehalococcoidia bacterium]|jgi:hypothetical protein|nr:hypothetical protein [Dehalococcoidia bacterium]